MATTTRGREGRNAPQTPGIRRTTSRRQRSNESNAAVRGDTSAGDVGPRAGAAGAAAAGSGSTTAPGTPPAKTGLRPLSRTGRTLALPLRQLVLLELALAAAGLGWLAGGAWLIVGPVVAVLLLLFAVVRRRGRAGLDWLTAVLAFRARTRRAAAFGAPAPAPGASPESAPDPALAPVAENVPGFGPYTYVDRDRRTVGMLGDGTFLTAVVRVEASGEALRPASGARALPLSLLGDCLEVDDIVLESAQLVQQVRAAPAPHLPEQSAARRTHAALQLQAAAPALRMTWIALKLDPRAAHEAVEARGGGVAGAQRCLVRVADHVASRVTGAGFRAAVLDQEELNSALATATCARTVHAPDPAGRPRRSAETARVWTCDDRWHTTYAVGRWPELGRAATPLPRVLSALAEVPSYATTVSLTVRRGPHRGATAVAGHVRVTGDTDTQLISVRKELERMAGSAKVALVRLDREQLPGVLATLPLGGASR
ncbi:type VII secretion protein EccE [Streptomyces sp. NPDC004111]|uniref:type VII secretion protein EccE n=1 Tax=Streptomyces sp. NPDC004111 TaxID=3364690 RepID=UPI00368559BB